MLAQEHRWSFMDCHVGENGISNSFGCWPFQGVDLPASTESFAAGFGDIEFGNFSWGLPTGDPEQYLWERESWIGLLAAENLWRRNTFRFDAKDQAAIPIMRYNRTPKYRWRSYGRNHSVGDLRAR